ncbi:protein LURP-one-related 7-like [Phragmites australis]|uniref:protein LURP-one-related 7-like n=1 Tax=Phragmites australis TaxID=29695 RepID=UPI002D76F2D5|nr:protein LURP-one-related 7-like [Phragmites australis]
MERLAPCAPPPPQPPLVPVARAVVPVDFTVVKKGPEMAMHDATGRLAFRVAAAAGGGHGGGRALLDAVGGTLVTVRSRSEGEWQAFSGNSLEQRDIIFTAKVISASSSQKEVHVFIPPRSTFEDPKPSYRLIGSTFRRACTIIKGNSIVVQTNLLYKLKKAIYSRRKFRVTIYPGNDNILIMSMIITFFIQN